MTERFLKSYLIGKYCIQWEGYAVLLFCKNTIFFPDNLLLVVGILERLSDNIASVQVKNFHGWLISSGYISNNTIYQSG